ncbi:hypothetical protein CLOM_g7607 [Closterium sp. NIES-68]|nr:hypothetical protein CLOM_g7607 [Closterium sp. NIES-68]
MSESLTPLDVIASPPPPAPSADLHHRARVTQHDDATFPVDARTTGDTDSSLRALISENHGDHSTSSGSGSGCGSGGGAGAWTAFRKDLVVVGLAFLLLFAAYSAMQNLETSLHPTAGMGAASLAVIYGGIVVFAPLAPAVIRYLRPRAAMLVGMSGYCAYIAANAVDSSWVLLLSAAYLGACASVLWVAQGLYCVMVARGHAAATGVAEQAAIAEFSGIFWGIFAANQVVGNAVTFLVCQLMALIHPSPALPAATAAPTAADPEGLPPATVTVLIVTFLVFLALAAALTCLLRDLSEDHPLCAPTPRCLEGGTGAEERREGSVGDGNEGGNEGTDNRGAGGESKALLGGQGEAAGGVGAGAGSRPRGGRSAWELMGDRRLQLLLPLLLYIGLQSAFVAADFTLYVVRPALGVAWIGGAMSVFGVANSLACMAAARFSSGLPSILATLLIGAACQVAVLLSLLLLGAITATPWLAFSLVLLQAVLWGVGDAAFQSQINALLPLVFPSDMDASFAHMKMWTSAASSLMFLLSPLLSLPAKAALLTLSCVVSLPLMLAGVHVP